MLSRTALPCLLVLLWATQTLAQPAISAINPLALEPGKTTVVSIAGQNLKAPLQVWTSCNAAIAVQSVEPTLAVLHCTLPANADAGLMGLWIATADGPSDFSQMLIDDLPTVADNGANHSKSQAQAIAIGSGVDGTSDGSQSDFYQIKLAVGQSVSIEVLAQRIGSTMDPIVSIFDPQGKQVKVGDDETTGADCHFNFRSDIESEFTIEVRDNKFAAGGRYRLRVGDFPIVDFAYPLAVQKGNSTKVSFFGPLDKLIDGPEVQPESHVMSDSVLVATKGSSSTASTWAPVLVRDFALIHEPTDGSPLPSDSIYALPVGISGRLTKANEQDTYSIQGVAGQAIRVSSRTRSLGTSALLQMKLVNSAGATVVETQVGELDEWSFDYTFPDAGIYRLVVNDLLKRGGPSHAYFVEIVPLANFAISFKADPNTRERYALEPETGAIAIDLQIQRSGYAGPIEIKSADAASGLQIVNPTIPANVADARIYLKANETWKGESIQSLRLVAKAVDLPKLETSVRSVSVRRLKAPHQPFPAHWVDGLVAVGGVPKGETFFSLEPASPLVLPRPVLEHSIVLNLKRLNAEFKEPIALMPGILPAGWTMTPAIDKDTYTLAIVRPATEGSQAPSMQLQAFAEFKGRGRLERFDLPIQWFDPLQLEIKTDSPLVAGQSASVRVVLNRQGSDPQPVQLKWLQLPAGITGPETMEIAKEQSEARFQIQVTADTLVNQNLPLQIQATTKYLGKDLVVSSPIASLSVSASPSQITTYPSKVELRGSRDRQQLLAMGFEGEEAGKDWSRIAQWKVADESLAQIRDGVLYPIANGTTQVNIELGKHRATIPVTIKGMEMEAPIQFENEVLVSLSKQGCNSGACHGSPSGKGNFRLSLRAFDEKLDQLTLIREDFGRRINPIEPDQSLLLLKPLMKIPHGGGTQLHRSDSAYVLLRNWIAQGAKADPAGTARCTQLEILPKGKQVLKRIDGSQQLAVMAHFGDGTSRDVTHLVAYESSNSSVATVDTKGLVTCHDRGEVVILARFLEHIESIPLMFVEDIQGFEWKSLPNQNYIDGFVDAKLKQLQYSPAALSTDSEFLRRVYLDVVGILPTVAESQAFLSSPSPDKRSRLIRELLQRPEHAKFWTLKWGDLLKMTSKILGDDGVYKYHRWIEQSIAQNMPYDEFARQLLVGSGSTLSNPPANFYRTSTDMNECVETISQVFLGARLQCAKCHNHPFERWTQDNYYGMGAFFQRVQRRKTQRPGEMFVWTAATGEVTQPRTGQIMKPWLPQQGSLSLEGDQDRRLAFAEWLIRPDNPYFARIEANRIWSQLFARGIVDPIDDFRDSNPPTNGPLLDALEKDFVGSGFDRRHLLEVILNSRTYQSSFRTDKFNEKDKLYFSHQEPRLLGAEQLLDALNQLMGTEQVLGGLPAGTRATQLPAPDVVKVDFLKVFGQPERATVCACERADDTNLGMAIELFNGPLIYEKLRNPNNRIRKAIAEGKSMEDTIRELYVAGVCRAPTDQELAAAMDHCKTRGDNMAGLEDVCWALLNTDEFLFQH